MNAPVKQHVIDPEICIRCYTCEEACPIDAITHNDDNVVVDVTKCNFCMNCIAPCPTGSIDNWRVVKTPYSLDEQFEWLELPEQQEISTTDASGGSDTVEALDDAVERLLAEAHHGAGGKSVAPASASKPTVNLFNRANPAIATVQGNYRLTAETSDSDVRHIILDLGSQVFPVLEGQSVGVAAPGNQPNGERNLPRLYSISSPRDGERPNTNNIAFTVKREPEGLCSNYLCDLRKGDTVQLTGPFGATFLMPNTPEAKLVMICTGTGSAPFRAFTMRRQRSIPEAEHPMMLFFGARTPDSLPYFGPLKKVPESQLVQHMVFSRIDGKAKEYVQDRMIAEAKTLAPLLNDDNVYIYVCGLKAMEDGVEKALATIGEATGINWSATKEKMRADGRYHVETY